MSTKKVEINGYQFTHEGVSYVVQSHVELTEIREALDGAAQAAQALDERCVEFTEDYSKEEKLDTIDWFLFKNDKLNSLLIV